MEAALSHLVQNKAEAVYPRSDLFERKRQLMEYWVVLLSGESGQ